MFQPGCTIGSFQDTHCTAFRVVLPACLRFWHVQRVHRVCADDSLTAEDIGDAFEALLRNMYRESPAAATPPPAQGLVKATPAAVEHVQELFVMLQPSSKQQQQFEQAAGRLSGLAAGDVRMARFWLDYEVRMPLCSVKPATVGLAAGGTICLTQQWRSYIRSVLLVFQDGQQDCFGECWTGGQVQPVVLQRISHQAVGVNAARSQ
jgi:hypothetical protein